MGKGEYSGYRLKLKHSRGSCFKWLLQSLITNIHFTDAVQPKKNRMELFLKRRSAKEYFSGFGQEGFMLDLPKKRVALSLLVAVVFFSLFPMENSLSFGMQKKAGNFAKEGEALVKIEKSRYLIYLEKDEQ